MEFPAQKGDHVINYQERNQQEMHDQLLRQFKHKKAFKHVMTVSADIKKILSVLNF